VPARVYRRLKAPRGRDSLRAPGETAAGGTNDRDSCCAKSIAPWPPGSAAAILNRDFAGPTIRMNASGVNLTKVFA
jgi:hypothetical protein